MLILKFVWFSGKQHPKILQGAQCSGGVGLVVANHWGGSGISGDSNNNNFNPRYILSAFCFVTSFLSLPITCLNTNTWLQ